MTPKDLSAYAQVCKRHGITSISLDGVKVSFTIDPLHTPPPRLTKKQKAVEEELKELSEMSEEDLALYSAATPGDA